MSKRERRQQRLEQHYARMVKLAEHNGFQNADGKKLSTKLLRIEQDTHRAALAWCNGEIDSVEWELRSNKARAAVNELFGGELKGLLINGDARGYALKIDDEYVREHGLDLHQDWGGYGILAPEIDGEAYLGSCTGSYCQGKG